MAHHPRSPLGAERARVRPRHALRVLVADGQPTFRVMLERFLTARGHRVTTVADAASALGRLESESPDVVLLDLSLPGSGWALLEQIRQHGFGGRILLMSDAQTFPDRPLPRGFKLIWKPFSPERILALVEAPGAAPRLAERG